MKFIKQIVGIDIAKKKFDYSIGTRDENYSIKFSSVTTKLNVLAGFKALLNDIKSLKNKDVIVFMEATGNYYESLCYFLKKENIKVCVVHATKISNFIKSFNQKSKTDSIDAKMIAHYGLEREEILWEMPTLMARRLKEKTREHHDLTLQVSKLKIQIKSYQSGFEPDPAKLKRIRKHIDFIEEQLNAIESEINKLIETDNELKEKIEKIQKVEGIGQMTILKVLSETQFFENFCNMKQVASYAGLDVKIKESGQFKGQGRLSKKGNEILRSALYMPSISAIRYNPAMKIFYQRLVGNGKKGKQARMAVARKLLLLIFTLWKTGRTYDQFYGKNIRVANA